MVLPGIRGPLTEFLFSHLRNGPGEMPAGPVTSEDPLRDDDLQLALYCCYELHYRGFENVNERWEWDPSLLAFRAELEKLFETAITHGVGIDLGPAAPGPIAERLLEIAASEEGPSLSRYLETRGTVGQLREFLIHRSAYQLKEADPHSWAIPRLHGKPKAALVEIQADEYGGGDPNRIHAKLFARSMEAVGLDAGYGAYVNELPGMTLATVNLMSMFGLHRRWRGAITGHLALYEMTSTEPNRRYGNALRRLGFGGDATSFFDEHVEADSVHEQVAAHDLAGGLADQDPRLIPDIIFGARSLEYLEAQWARHLLDSWTAGRSSLLQNAVIRSGA